MASASETVLTRAFIRITSAALCYFIAIGAITPVLPRFIHDQLGGNGVAVGIGVGSFAVSAALLRPIIGKIGDRRGRRVLLVGGTAVAAVSILGYTLATSLWV